MKNTRKVTKAVITAAKAESELLAIQRLLSRFTHHYGAHQFCPKLILDKISELNDQLSSWELDFDEIIERLS